MIGSSTCTVKKVRRNVSSSSNPKVRSQRPSASGKKESFDLERVKKPQKSQRQAKEPCCFQSRISTYEINVGIQ